MYELYLESCIDIVFKKNVRVNHVRISSANNFIVSGAKSSATKKPQKSAAKKGKGKKAAESMFPFLSFIHSTFHNAYPSLSLEASGWSSYGTLQIIYKSWSKMLGVLIELACIFPFFIIIL